MFQRSIFGEQNEYDGRVFLRSYNDALECLEYLAIEIQGNAEEEKL